MDASFDVADPRAQAFISNRSFKFATDVNETTQSALRGSLSEGLAGGESIPELRKRVQSVFTDGYGPLNVRAGKARAEMIARSEIVRASNAGAELGYMQSGVVEAKEWYASISERTCEYCLEMHGKTMGLGEAFFAQGDVMTVEGGSSIKLDYEEVRHPPLHPRCYSADTQIYIRRGWQLVSNAVIGDEVMTVNPKTRERLWGAHVVATTKHEATEMVHIYGDRFDMLVTVDHPFFGYRLQDGKKPKAVFIDGIDALPDDFAFYGWKRGEQERFYMLSDLQVERDSM